MGQITTHILDTARGLPAAGIPVELSRKETGEWINVGSGVTDNDGRIKDLVNEEVLPEGIYLIRFETLSYYQNSSHDCFYPWVEVVFHLQGSGHYHIPLLLSPYGYSTYRGS